MFNTYEEMLSLKSRDLATSKVQGNLEIFKYSRKVMYDYMWEKEPSLLECRGHAYDRDTGNIVVYAPRKSFNYLENNTGLGLSLDTECRAYKKYNGYMLCVTVVDGDLLWSTTGSLDSDYVKFAKEKFKDHYVIKNIQNNPDFYTWTYLFEVVDSEFDPHIVNDKDGLHYLGARTPDGYFYPSEYSRVVVYDSLSNIIQMAKTNRGEGFMVYPESGGCFKLKTDYYVGKKKLMRMTEKNSQRVLESLKDSELFEPVLAGILRCSGSYSELSEQDRRKYIEDIIG